jgi:cold shock protein
MPTGTVRSFDPKRGFGFITPDDGSRDVFVHLGAVRHAGLQLLHASQKLSYELRSELDGRKSAVELKAL